MRLSTKELFTSSRKGSKMKLNNINNSNCKSSQEKIKRKTNNSSKTLRLNSKNQNPFVNSKFKPSDNNNQLKRKIVRRNTNIIIPKTTINFFDEDENSLKDSLFGNILFSSEKSINKHQEENIENNNYENGNDLYKLYQLNKESNLRKTIIIDKKGNNNLNIPKNMIQIQDYKNKTSFKNTKENKKIITPINHKESKKYISTTYNNINRKNVLNKIENNNLKNFKENNDVKAIKKILHKKLLSTKETIPKINFKFNKENNKKEKEEQNIEDKNSLFEDYTNRSFSSSFLGSSFNDIF